MKSYPSGNLIRLETAFRDEISLALVDPTTAVCTVTPPSGVATNPTVVKDAVGLYHSDVTAVEPGVWTYVFSGSSLPARDVGQFYVRPDPD